MWTVVGVWYQECGETGIVALSESRILTVTALTPLRPRILSDLQRALAAFRASPGADVISNQSQGTKLSAALPHPDPKRPIAYPAHFERSRRCFAMESMAVRDSTGNSSKLQPSSQQPPLPTSASSTAATSALGRRCLDRGNAYYARNSTLKATHGLSRSRLPPYRSRNMANMDNSDLDPLWHDLDW